MLLNLLEYHWAEHIDDALMLLSRPEIKTVPLAGGTSLLGGSDESIQAVVDLRDVGLSYITEDARGIHIGAMTTLQMLVDAPILKSQVLSVVAQAAAASTSSRQLRAAATVGGTLALGAASDADLLTVLIALETVVVLRSGSRTQVDLSAGSIERPGLALSGVTFKGKQERRVPLQALEVERRPSELIVEIIIPRLSSECSSSFMRVGRTLSDGALINVVALVLLQNNVYQQVRLALGGVQMEPQRLQLIEEQLEGQAVDEVIGRQIWSALQAGISAFVPSTDFRASNAYRRISGMNLAYRALEEAVGVSQWRNKVSSEGRA